MNKKEKEKRKIWIRIKGLKYIIQVWNDTQNTKKKKSVLQRVQTDLIIKLKHFSHKS